MRYAIRRLLALALSSVPLFCQAPSVNRTELAEVLNFEAGQKGGPPRGWGGAPRETLFTDDKIVHSGKLAARLERDKTSPGNFSSITIGFPIDFTGTRLELRGFLKTQ